MKKGDKRKRDKALKRRAARTQASRRERATGSASVYGSIRRARGYPIYGCWIAEGWQEHGLAVVVVARRQPNGNVVFGAYMVDRYCLGLKNTFCDADIPISEFQNVLLSKVLSGMPAVEISAELAHEIIYGGIEYAREIGFRPHRDFKRSRYVLDPPDAHPRTGQVEFGKDGKPLYIQGPHDNVQAILRQLDRAVGEGNYHYLVQIDGPTVGALDE